MHWIFRIFISTFFLIALQSCTHFDNYMLGKDNSPEPSPLKPLKNKEKLVQAWSVSLPTKNTASHLKLKPEIVNNTLYTADNHGLVQAVDKLNGKLIWSKKLNAGVISGPMVASGSLALGTDDSSVVLLKQSNGEELWRTKVSGEVLAKPVITDQKVIAKTIDGNLYAFDLNSGEKLWHSTHGAPNLILKASSSPIVAGNDLVLVGYSDGKLDAVDLKTGRLVWQRSLAYGNGSSDIERLVDIDADPIISNNVIYLASYQGYVGALSLLNGEFIWKKQASVYKNMAMDKKSLYFTDSEDVVWSLDLKNGQINWKTADLKARELTEPVVVGNRLVLGDKTGILHVLATADGELISRTKLSGAVTTAPSISDNNLYVMTNYGQLSRYAVS